MPQSADQVLREVMEAIGDARLLLDCGHQRSAKMILLDAQFQIRCHVNGVNYIPISREAETAP